MSGKITPADWATIITLYERGEMGVRELARKYNCTHQAVSEGLRKRGIQRSSKLEEVRGEVVDAAAEARKKRVQQATTMQENYARYYEILARLAISKISNAEKNQALQTANADMITLKNAIAVVSRARQESWDTLNIPELLTEEDELPELNVGEYTPEELDEMRAANEEAFRQGQEEDDADFNFSVDDEDNAED